MLNGLAELVGGGVERHGKGVRYSLREQLKLELNRTEPGGSAEIIYTSGRFFTFSVSQAVLERAAFDVWSFGQLKVTPVAPRATDVGHDSRLFPSHFLPNRRPADDDVGAPTQTILT